MTKREHDQAAAAICASVAYLATSETALADARVALATAQLALAALSVSSRSDVLTVPDACRSLQLARSIVNTMLSRGDIRSVKLNGSRRVQRPVRREDQLRIPRLVRYFQRTVTATHCADSSVRIAT